MSKKTATKDAPMRKYATIVGPYRYWLERVWATDPSIMTRGYVNFIMLNPSTADAEVDDPTVRKCIGFAQRWGYDAMHIVNLFALRSPDPSALRTHPEPIGPDNHDYIDAGFLSGDLTIVAWGKHGAFRGRAEAVLRQYNALSCKPRLQALRLNDDGSPEHPLYIPYDAKPVPWPAYRATKEPSHA